MMDENKHSITRRSFLESGMRGACLLALGGVAGFTVSKALSNESIWQIDPYKCVACGNCATYCVLKESAVKCVQSYPMCGYCDLCTAFFDPDPRALHTGAENQLCPTGAIIRTFIEDPYFDYTIDEKLCIGCAKCVEGCKVFGNGSLYLQVRHDRCKNCNECAISVACPSQAFLRVPASQPYLLKGTNTSE